jgi:alpha-mannosidase
MNPFPKLKVLSAALLLAASTLAPAVLQAQGRSGGPIPKIIATLPTQSQEVLTRLGTLSTLPDTVWKMHPADLTHGEEVSIDDSSWKPMAMRDKAPQEAVWFRTTVTLPADLGGYDLTGARIWFHFNSGGSNSEILYFNGRRVALGEDLEPVVLFENAKPGDKVVIAVKLLHTASEKSFRGATFHIDYAATRPNPSDLRTEFLSAAELLPSLVPNDPAGLATQVATLNKSIEAVDLKALDAKNQSAFDASLLTAQHQLEALRPLLEKTTFHLTGNSHIDAAWLWPWTETVDVVKRTFGTALQLMYEYPKYTYTQSAAAYNDWMADKYPAMNTEIEQRIKEGRWEVVGGMWVEPDLNMPDGESLVRQLLVGKRWYKQHYGVDVRIGWNPDSFGYTWQLPQIYKKSGVDYFVTQKMSWNDTNQLPFKLFWWESPDGSKVLTYFPHGYGNTNLSPIRLSEDMVTAREQAPGLPEMMDLYGVGDHGGGPTRVVLDEGMHWANADSSSSANATNTVHPKYDFALAQPFFSSVEKELAPSTAPAWDYTSIAKGYTPPTAVEGKIAIPTWNSELYLEYHRGVFTTQANHKRNMRESSESILNAEKWSSLAWLDGKEYPGAELTEDWKKVLFNQFHDLAAGSGIAVIYRDAQKDYDDVRWSTNEIRSNSLQIVADRIDTSAGKSNPSGQAILVWNPLGWQRGGEVWIPKAGYPEGFAYRISGESTQALHSSKFLTPSTVAGVDGYSIYLKDIPALGYKVLHMEAHCKGAECDREPKPEIPIARQENGSFVLDNAYLHVAIDGKTGCITSILNKQTKFENLTSGACGNALQAFKDNPKEYDAWNIDPGTLDEQPTLLNTADKVELVGSTGVRVTKNWQKSKFVQTIGFGNDGQIIDIDNEIDWHESHILLKAAFPLAVQSDHATYEIPYGTIERSTKRDNTWEKAQFEVPAQQWADISGTGSDGKVHGLSLINDSKFGYDAAGNVLRLTLLRSPKSPDPDADMGHHHFHYALYPHAGTWKEAQTIRRGYEYNYPLTAVVTTAHPGSLPASHSFVSVPEENVVLTAVKKAEDANGLILRAYEWAGKTGEVHFKIPAGATSATVTNMQEIPEGSPLKLTPDESKTGAEGQTITVPIHPYEILTIRADYPKK